MATRRTLSGFSVYVDGADFVGVALGFTPPDVELETEDSNQPGHAGTIKIETLRLMELEAEFTMGDSDPRLEALVGNPRGPETPVHFVEALAGGRDPDVRSVEYAITGLWTKQSPGETGGGRGGGGGDGKSVTYTISVRTLKHVVDGAEMRFVDVEENVHRIAGADVLAPVRAALGAGSVL